MQATHRSAGIFGGGVAGLAAGIALLRRGYAAAIHETNARAGGCCATTRVDGYTFNDGAMHVAIPELLDHGFERLGLDRHVLLPLRRIEAMQTTKTGLPKLFQAGQTTWPGFDVATSMTSGVIAAGAIAGTWPRSRRRSFRTLHANRPRRPPQPPTWENNENSRLPRS